MNRYFYHKDHLGSVVGISDLSGNKVIEYDYDVFGKAYLKVNTGEHVSIENYTGNIYNNYRLYTSREYDCISTGQADANLGRFVSRVQYNHKIIVGNNSVKYVDP